MGSSSRTKRRHTGSRTRDLSAAASAEPTARILGGQEIEHLTVDQIKPSDNNPRAHSKKQIKQIAASIKRFGFNGVIVINKSGMIIAGHGRLEAARLIGMKTVPCVRVTHLQPAEEMAYRIADNQIALSGRWVREELADQLAQLEISLPELDLDISITGFDVGEIDALFADHGDAAADPQDEVDFPSADAQPVTRSGDIWLLGQHRLICGDARDEAVLAALMDGKLADQVITDPPFNVQVNGHVGGRGRRKHAEFANASGEMTAREYREFLVGSVEKMIESARDGALIYIFIDWRHVEVVCDVGRSLGLELINICVWSKTTPGQGTFYRSAHELIVVFQKPGEALQNNIALGRYGRSRTNVWTFAAPNKFKAANDPLAGHPTPKPVAMIAEAIKDASKRGGVVLDSFLGSGTTILAAEKVGRIGYGVECDPTYCDLAITRWQAFAGRDAILAATGQTFDEIAAEPRKLSADRSESSAARRSKRISGKQEVN